MTKPEATQEQAGGQKQARKKQEGRSPSYPGIPLGEAIGRARTIFENDGRNAAPVSAILSHWGYKMGSGPGTITLAALKKFGLLTDDGSGPKRTAKLTELALRIVLDAREDSPERAALTREAALKPSIHAELWREFEGVVPSDETLRHKLILDRKFTQRGADEFIQQFRSTLDFARLKEDTGISPLEREKPGHPDPLKAKNGGNAQGASKMLGIREEAFTLDEGQATLTWPSQISMESAADLEAWLNLIIKKARRLAGGNKRGPKDEPGSGTDA